MNDSTNHYVYVYIDPRNFEEFYYGEGKGKRKFAHLSDHGVTPKAERIKEIYKEGLKPIIKVVAAGLTKAEALLVEKTLIWQLGGQLTNVSSGYYADKFRPHNTLHQDLFGFDFHNGICYVNVGQGKHRAWADCKRYCFLAAGHGKQWSDQIKTLQVGDVVVAYLKGKGYVGVGIVQHEAVRVRDFRAGSKAFSTLQAKLECPNIFDSSDDPEKSEYLVAVDWKATADAEHAKWKSRSHLFTTQLVKASLANQSDTLSFIEHQFHLKLKNLLT